MEYKLKVYKGLICVHDFKDSEEVLFLSSVNDPLADELEWISNKSVTARYWITKEELTRDEANEEYMKTVSGYGRAELVERYSEITGHLWTDEFLNIGGHNLLAELQGDVGKWIILELEVHP